jgi:HPt (histidine-containing phosphotransfer) domain-containing protein
VSGADDHLVDPEIVEQLLELGTDLFAELIDLYEQQLPRLLESIDAGDRRAAHALRGSSANMGLLAVAALAAQVEQGMGVTTALRTRAHEGIALLRSRVP